MSDKIENLSPERGSQNNTVILEIFIQDFLVFLAFFVPEFNVKNAFSSF